MKRPIKRRLILCSMALVLLFGFSKVHDYYVTVTQITYNEQAASLQITSRIFIDDLQTVIRTHYDKDALLDTPDESDKIDRYLNRYFHKKIKIEVDGEPQEFVFLGKEYEAEMALCYLEIRSVLPPKTIKIKNQVLMDLFEEQQNIIHVKKGTLKKSLLLEKGSPEDMLKFSE